MTQCIKTVLFTSKCALAGYAHEYHYLLAALDDGMAKMNYSVLAYVPNVIGKVYTRLAVSY